MSFYARQYQTRFDSAHEPRVVPLLFEPSYLDGESESLAGQIAYAHNWPATEVETAILGRSCVFGQLVET